MRIAAFLFLLLVIAIIFGANTGQLPGFLELVNDLPYGDKVAHFFLMGILSFLVNASALITFPNRKPVQVAFITTTILLVLIVLEEGSQNFLPRRTMSGFDLLCDFLGVGLAAWLALRWGRSRKVRQDG